MVIANPIYDVVFKRMMENERVAKFFIGTLLNQKIESIKVRPQEFTYTDKLAGLAVFRLDFIAIIKDDNGQNKKVLIEIQKAKNRIDLMRFRNYLAEQYKKQDRVEGIQEILPITTIYILGFQIPNIDSACIHVQRQYRDMIEERIIGTKSDFIEKLTHDSYIVQVGRIKDRFKSRIDKLLSVFEQAHFVGEGEVLKEYNYTIDEDELKLMAQILHHSGVDPESRRLIEIEREAWRTVDALVENERITFQKALDEKDKALDEKDKALDEKDKIIEALKRKINNSDDE